MRYRPRSQLGSGADSPAADIPRPAFAARPRFTLVYQMFVLGLKILVPLLPFVFAVRRAARQTLTARRGEGDLHPPVGDG